MTEPAGARERSRPADAVDATDLALRLVEETARRQQAEALAETATATADAETARATLVDLRASAVRSIASVQAQDRAARMTAMHQGLLALRNDLDGLRAAAEAAIAGAGPGPAPDGRDRTAPDGVAATPGDAAVRAPAASPASALAPELTRSAQELLAKGRLDVADEVIRGLEDAAARLRAQAPAPVDG